MGDFSFFGPIFPRLRIRGRAVLIILGATALLIILTALFKPDLFLLLRARSAPVVGTDIVYHLEWTPPVDTAIGDIPVTIEAVDGSGLIDSEAFVVSVLPTDFLIESVTFNEESDAIDVIWSTSEATIGSVEYGVTTALGQSANLANAIHKKNHSLRIDNLLPCTTYNIELTVNDINNQQAVDAVRTATTTGCIGGGSITGSATSEFDALSGGSMNLNSNIDVIFPAGFSSIGSVSGQIQQLDRDAVLNSLNSPGVDVSPVTGLFQLNVVSDTTQVTSFDSAVTIRMSYASTSNMDENSIQIYRSDGNSWQVLDNCVVDQGAKDITCTTDNFSVFAGFGIGDSSPDVSPVPTPTVKSNNNNSSGDGGGDSGGGGGGDEGEGNETEERPKRTFSFQPEVGHSVSGEFSGVNKEGSRSVVKLASVKSVLEKNVTATQGDYWAYVNAKHDKPGPVTVAMYVNNRPWKIIKLDKNDNRYRTHRVGLLRNFRGAKIRFRLINDVYDKFDPTNENKDRNFYIDWWALSEDSNLAKISLPIRTNGKPAVAGVSNSALMKRLNSIIREELGNRHVTSNIWSYYAKRLSAPVRSKEKISSEFQLRNVMRFWRGARPGNPRGG